jgi:AcrR family transcriptional regulator
MRRLRSSQYHHGDLKRALTEAARSLLEHDGPEAISFRAIARAAGVSQTAPYNHFQSKEDLLATVAAAGFRELEQSQFAAAAAARSGRDRLAALARDYVRFALKRPQLYRLMFGVGISDWRAHPVAAEAKRASFVPIRRVLAEYRNKGEADAEPIDTDAVAAWCLVHGLSMLLIDGSLDPAKRSEGNEEALIDAVVARFVTGLRHERVGD